jgi:hypothetical protein
MQIHRQPEMATNTALCGLVLVALLLLVGCGGDPNTPGAPTTVSISPTTTQPSDGLMTTPTPAPTSSSSEPAPTGTAPVETPVSGALGLYELSAGRTVQFHRGDRVVLTLHNTYWRIATPHSDILTQTGTQTVTPARVGTCLPGIGCGTVQAIFIASATGSAELTASRTTCGEALACPPGQGSYVVHLIVR